MIVATIAVMLKGGEAVNVAGKGNTIAAAVRGALAGQAYRDPRPVETYLLLGVR